LETPFGDVRFAASRAIVFSAVSAVGWRTRVFDAIRTCGRGLGREYVEPLDDPPDEPPEYEPPMELLLLELDARPSMPLITDSMDEPAPKLPSGQKPISR